MTVGKSLTFFEIRKIIINTISFVALVGLSWNLMYCVNMHLKFQQKSTILEIICILPYLPCLWLP